MWRYWQLVKYADETTQVVTYEMPLLEAPTFDPTWQPGTLWDYSANSEVMFYIRWYDSVSQTIVIHEADTPATLVEIISAGVDEGLVLIDVVTCPPVIEETESI